MPPPGIGIDSPRCSTAEQPPREPALRMTSPAAWSDGEDSTGRPADDGRDESAGVRLLHDGYRRVGKYGAIVSLTLLTTATALAVTYGAHSMFGASSGSSFRVSMWVAGMVPLLLTPSLAFMMLHLLDHLFKLEGQLRHQASHDVLTGLHNRRWILDRAARSVAESAQTRRALGVLIVDIDHFKVINDQLGHLAGDVVLRAVATRLKRVLRRNDCLGRFGGEEFLLLTHDVDLQGLRHCANRVIEAVSSRPIPYQQARLPITVSVGAAIITEGFDAAGLARALHDADRAMYQAKAAGRNRAELSLQREAAVGRP